MFLFEMRNLLNIILIAIFFNSLALSPKYHIDQIDSLVNATDSSLRINLHWLRTVNISQEIIDSSSMNHRFEIFTFIFVNKKVKVSMIDNFGFHNTLEFKNYQLAEFVKTKESFGFIGFSMKYSVDCFFKMEVRGSMYGKNLSVNFATYIPNTDNFSQFADTKTLFSLIRTYQNSFQSLRDIPPYSVYANVNIVVEKTASSPEKVELIRTFKIPNERFWYLKFK